MTEKQHFADIQRKQEEEQRQKQLEEETKIRQQKSLLELKKDLEKRNEKVRKTTEKALKKKEKQEKKVHPVELKTQSPKKQTKELFSQEDIKNNEKLLYVEATVKRLKVIEWIKGKYRVVLNKEREVRKTYVGGYSQKKFQDFVNQKKKIYFR